MNKRSLALSYLRQQKDLAMPDAVVSPAYDLKQSIVVLAPKAAPAKVSARPSVPAGKSPAYAFQGKTPAFKKQPDTNPMDRLSRLRPIASRIVEPLPPYGNERSGAEPPAGPACSTEKKRAALKELFLARCSACGLAGKRKKFVFGAGNVDAPLMIVGEAPGAEEDAQGLPFVGAAGQLLTTLLSDVAIDRKKDVFITNVLKCRPPDNRNPETSEIQACMPLLEKQIDIISPKLLLLLGRIAAHALLSVADGIGKLRGRMHEYRGIPAMVTYHPAALLRNAEYMRPAQEDFKKAARLLKEGSINGTS